MGGGLNGQDAYSGRIMAVKKSHWEGSQVHPTLNQSFNTGAIGYSNQEIFSQGGSGLVQAIPIHDQATRNAGKRGNKQDGKGNGLGVGKPGDPCPTLTKGDKHAVLYENHPNDSRVTGPHDVAPSCVSRYGTGGGNVPLVQPQDLMAVRRLTPRECERLQGFDDDHTMISWRNKPADECPDGPRYKALGNSMAVPCMAWIGKRIDAVEKAK
jgi:DNA (cytosine-5)-methyltransferase 1